MSNQQPPNQFQPNGAPLMNQSVVANPNPADILQPQAGQVDEETQEKLNQIRINEVKFEQWFEFMAKEQVGRMRTYMDNTLQDFTKKQQEFQKSQKAIEDMLKEFNSLQQTARAEAQSYRNTSAEKNSQIEELDRQKAQAQQNVDDIENQITDIKTQISKISAAYRVSEQLQKQDKEKLEDQSLIKMFTLLNYVLYDQQKFEWQDFQKRSFNVKNELDPKLLEQWLKIQNRQQSSILQSKVVLNQSPVKQDEEKKEGSASQTPANEQQPKQDAAIANEPAPDKIQIQLASINLGALPAAKIDKIKEFTEDQTVLQSSAYTNDVFMYKSIVECMNLVLKGNDLEKQKEEAEKELTRVKQDFRKQEKLSKSDEDDQLEQLWSQQQETNDDMIKRVKQVLNKIISVQQVLENGKNFVVRHADDFNNLAQKIERDIQIDEDILKK